MESFMAKDQQRMSLHSQQATSQNFNQSILCVSILFLLQQMLV